MRLAVVSAVAILVAASVGCRSATVYQKGAPRRVEVRKQASGSTVVLSAERRADGAVRLKARSHTPVRLERDVHYSTYETRIEHTRNPLWELIEIPLGLTALAIGPAVFFMTAPVKNSEDVEFVAHGAPFLWPLNPLQGFVAFRLTGRVSDRSMFSDPTVVRSYAVQLPVPGLTLSYRVLDFGHRVLATGTLRTDDFGHAHLADVSLDAVGIEVDRDGKSWVVLIESRHDRDP